MPDDTTLSDAARLLSPQLLQDTRSDTARVWTTQALCVGADPEAFFPPGDDRRLAPKLGPSARHVPYAASAWPMRSPLMSGSASGAVLIPDSGALCEGGWSGVVRPHRQKPGPLRDPGTAAAARQDRRERPVVTADGPRRSGRRRACRDDDPA